MDDKIIGDVDVALAEAAPMPATVPVTAASVDAATQPLQPASAQESLFRNRNFLWICVGVGLAMLGNQFTALALPWLVLKMTGDSMALATVMVIGGVPQIVLLLFGGGLADRYSPKRILTWSYLSCAFLLLSLSGLLFLDRLELWMVNVFAFLTGLVFGTSIPASFSLIGAALPKELVPAGSSVIGSLRQGLAFVGPLLAGALLGLSSDQDTQHAAASLAADMHVYGVAFLIDGTGLLIVAWTMAQVMFRPAGDGSGHGAGSGFSMLPALKWFASDRQVLTVVIYWSLVVFVLSGPVRIALPLLAEQSAGLGAQAYGALVSANAAGVFLGMTALGLLRAFVSKRLWPVILFLDTAAALLVVAVAWIEPDLHFTLAVYAALFVLVGTRAGFVEIGWFSWLQQRYPDEIRGRTTSIFMIISTINISASVALSGWLTRQMPAKELFLLAGMATLVVVVLGMVLRMFGVMRVEA